jgi:type I restriction enzyme R subunit
VEFKQIIGRGSRVRDDYGKYFFTILDYTGAATRHFADPEFDGEPTLITEQEMDEAGQVKKETFIEPEEPSGAIYEHEKEEKSRLPEISELLSRPRKYYVDGGQVEISAHMVYELDADGNQLRVVKYTDYTADKMRKLYPHAATLRNQWADPEERSRIIERLAERGINFEDLAQVTKQSEADPLDLLCHVAYNSPLRTRRERADYLRNNRKDFFAQYADDARSVLNELLEKYAEHGVAQFTIPDVLKLEPISSHGNVMEIASHFGGPAKLREAVNQLQNLLYSS